MIKKCCQRVEIVPPAQTQTLPEGTLDAFGEAYGDFLVYTFDAEVPAMLFFAPRVKTQTGYRGVGQIVLGAGNPDAPFDRVVPQPVATVNVVQTARLGTWRVLPAGVWKTPESRQTFGLRFLPVDVEEAEEE